MDHYVIEKQGSVTIYIKKKKNFIFKSLAPKWAELAVQYAHNEYIQIGRVNCMENEMTCKNFDIKQYPFLLWVVNGRIVSTFFL